MDLFSDLMKLEEMSSKPAKVEITLESVSAAGGSMIVRGLPANVYHRIPAISSTLLKGYAANPATCRTPYEPKEDANVGTAAHAFCLQGEAALYEECFFLGPETMGKSKGAMMAREDAILANPGKTPLPYEYGGVPIMDCLRNVDAALKSHPTVGNILRNSEKELSLFWIDPETGVLCKVRLDIWCPKTRQIFDLKKTSKFDDFGYQIRKLGYGLQAAFYLIGAQACGLDPLTFGLIPVEAEDPYRVGIGYLRDNPNDTEGLLLNAQAEAHRLLGLIVESTLTGNFPNYKLPTHLFSLSDIQPEDLMSTWDSGIYY